MWEIVRGQNVEIDLIEAADYIARDRPAAAGRFLLAAESRFRQIANNPTLGVCDEFDANRLEGVRRWRIKEFPNYLVFYRASDEYIEILQVVHGARDIESLFND